ncbi:MAG: flagellar biosynthesis protein FlhB [Deltaproteobacteria bacterium]|nr:flagellar biosynthesis protein FlhB [Deltaproteobacteria bacterium]
MAEESFQDKTEQATPKKREDARKKGQVAKSREVSSIAILAAGVIYMFFNADRLIHRLEEDITGTFANIPQIASGELGIETYLSQTIQDFLILILPMLILLLAVSLGANLLQTGFIMSVEPLTPDMSKIDPIKGLGRIVSKRTIAELLKSIFKIIIVGWAVFSTLKNDYKLLIPLMYQDNIQIFNALGQISLKVLTRACYVIFVLAVLDYIYQRWEFEQNLKMTKQEVKDESRQTEGDPLVKGRIRSIQREMAKRRMMKEVPKADVVITNPTHYAVALVYRPEEKMTAPKIIAKGADRIALKIKEIAAEQGIPMVENRPLAQNLYKLDIGQEVPPKFYKAVAEILAYVYGLKNKKAGKV